MAIAKDVFKYLPLFYSLLEYGLGYPRFKLDIKNQHEKVPDSKRRNIEESLENASVYHNQIEVAVFETELAHAILNAAPKTASEKVNQAIIDYLLKHKIYLLKIKNLFYVNN